MGLFLFLFLSDGSYDTYNRVVPLEIAVTSVACAQGHNGNNEMRNKQRFSNSRLYKLRLLAMHLADDLYSLYYAPPSWTRVT